MDDKTATLAVHTACVATIAACLALAFTVLKPYPWAAGMLLMAAAWLWGKLGFKPANPVLARILQQLDPMQVAVLSQRPPEMVMNALASTRPTPVDPPRVVKP